MESISGAGRDWTIEVQTDAWKKQYKDRTGEEHVNALFSRLGVFGPENSEQHANAQAARVLEQLEIDRGQGLLDPDSYQRMRNYVDVVRRGMFESSHNSES